jgi:hypothetical protein
VAESGASCFWIELLRDAIGWLRYVQSMAQETSIVASLPRDVKGPGARGKRWALGLWSAQVVMTVAAIIAAAIKLETIVGTGPILSVIGLALARATRPLRSWAAQLFALSGPMVSAFCALLIAVLHWGPDVARRPILTIGAIYILLAIPIAWQSLQQVLQWQVDATSREGTLWQFSLKSLLILTTAAGVLLLPARWILKELPLANFSIGFGLYAGVTAALAGVALWRFVSRRRAG